MNQTIANKKANPFISLSSAQDRLNSWKELRANIADMNDMQAMEAVAEYWGNAPISNYSYDFDHCDEWPTPWEMVSKGDWCSFGVAIAMEFTLRLAGWDENRLKLIHLRDYDISAELLVLKIDDCYALNYSIGKVIEYPNTEQIITQIWQYHGKHYTSLTV